MQPKLSLIIAYTWSKDENRLNGVTALIESITNQTCTNYETIVVEDGQGREEAFFPFKNKVDKVILLNDPKGGSEYGSEDDPEGGSEDGSEGGSEDGCCCCSLIF
jgi:hypothetical protein